MIEWQPVRRISYEILRVKDRLRGYHGYLQNASQCLSMPPKDLERKKKQNKNRKKL